MEKITINTPYIRLDSFLKFAALTGSGGEAKILIQDGKIMVNGEKCIMRGKKLVSGDLVTAGGKDFVVVGTG